MQKDAGSCNWRSGCWVLIPGGVGGAPAAPARVVRGTFEMSVGLKWGSQSVSRSAVGTSAFLRLFGTNRSSEYDIS